MTVQLATLCDSASDYSGKLCILGAFDTLCAREFPVVHPHCALVVRLIFEPRDAGRHTFTIRCLDPSGQDCLPPFEPVVDVAFPSQFLPFVTRNIVLNLQRLRIEKQGVYRWNIETGGITLASIPLRATLFEDPRGAAGPAG
ncbi:MAG TPA: hypothetical protein DIT64_09905 [Verrucomicrobiales bacterium]|nr:hypothetical protein [Verrucomicrobiales bacterium]HCN75943.1 hypothetical protein [Verrucomicrobiales bacterium]HRJ07578.1 hypothetical protein [Prosthecobacter sp.]HRK14858.1 hypothetical protein [Prosthecobacter sp.]